MVLWYRFLYRPVQRLLHRFNLHYMPLSYPDGDTLAWCHWCGIREVVDYDNKKALEQIRGDSIKAVR